MKLRCKVFGCLYDDHCSCARCGEDLYSGLFIQIGWIDPVYTIIRKWKQNRWKRRHPCEVCKQVMFFTDDHCCSKDCYDEWIPF